MTSSRANQTPLQSNEPAITSSEVTEDRSAARPHEMSGSTGSDQTRDAPRGVASVLAAIGPGLIVAGSIVGSGELIATTKTGAEAGFSLLWLIVLGCVVKVFVQVELGRNAIITGQTTLAALNDVPGPRLSGRGNWLVWYWLITWITSISQLGGIVGGVGQSLEIALPIGLDPAGRFSDAVVWAGIVTLITCVLLVRGRYTLIQNLSTVLVASFTALTIGNLLLLQQNADFAVTWTEFIGGLSFHLPPSDASGSSAAPVGTALATFGIIGVGAGELIAYPYWCLEKGYAKSVGPLPKDAQSDAMLSWQRRAAGWMRVMRIDAWGSMVVYTFATVAFYLLGAGTLWRLGLNPEKGDLIRTLSEMYVPVFSSWASSIFLFGAFAVLFSTFFVAIAAHARTFSDAMRVVGLIADDEVTRRRWIRILSGVFPILCWMVYVYFPQPAKLVLISGIAQGIMLPMLAGAAIYFRYDRMVDGLRPGRRWDFMLWASALAMLVTGSWTIFNQFQ